MAAPRIGLSAVSAVSAIIIFTLFYLSPKVPKQISQCFNQTAHQDAQGCTKEMIYPQEFHNQRCQLDQLGFSFPTTEVVDQDKTKYSWKHFQGSFEWTLVCQPKADERGQYPSLSSEENGHALQGHQAIWRVLLQRLQRVWWAQICLCRKIAWRCQK